MPETITAFYSFSSGTKARSSYVNANFTNYRGTILPIDPNTSTASNNTYNLGSSEWRWLTGYMRTLDLIGMTTTNNLTIERDNAVTAGAWAFKNGGTEFARLGSNGFEASTLGVKGLTTTTHLTLAHDNSTTAGAFNIKVGTGQIGSVRSDGVSFKKKVTSFNLSNVSVLQTTRFTMGSMSVTTYGGIIEISLQNNTALPGYVGIDAGAATGTAYHEFLRDGITIANYLFQVPSGRYWLPASTFRFIDDSVTAGGHTYVWHTWVDTATANSQLGNVRINYLEY